MENKKERQPDSQQPAFCNPAEPYGPQSPYRNPIKSFAPPAYRNPAVPYSSPQAAYNPSLYSDPQDAKKHARSLLRSAGNTASFVPIIEQIIASAFYSVFLFAWLFANINQFLPSIKAGNIQEVVDYLTKGGIVLPVPPFSKSFA
ncbi:hypothetical protein [Thermocaproicibacter melissae]|uniref:hypothetical protein n=1 Tax=Thermocaproicibacter melissae TaxID=2966552 RepID=UPI0024B2386B|nr:hypothetical protein [Thermocaproicibacter melissae]WBY63850.1 hypothetical protein NOG13_07740 [Thermocaproicibacter melissae]